MMKFSALLGSTCIVSLAFAAPAAADTTVSSDSTTPLVTSSAGNILIKKDVELEVSSGAAIAVDSNHTVTTEEDDEDDSDDEPAQITTGEDDGATGILINAGTTTTITNAGTISVLEDFIPADEDENSIADGALASASDRYGIHVASGGTVTGTIENSGTMTVEGLYSAGIALDSTLNGSLTNTGTIRVVGDYSYGVRTGDVTGDIVMEGTTTVTGRGARALSIEGDVGGTVRIQGTVAHQTYFVYDDDDNTISLSRYDLRLSTPAVAVEGNVAGGIIVATAPSDDDDDDDDEDDDGVTDSDEGTGSVIAYGNGPAILIASDEDITIGTLPSANGSYSLLIEGTVSGTANYSQTDAYGVVIGGAGGTVSLPGGIGVTGALTATTQDSAATALLINEGATVPYLYNSGTIRATISSQGEGEAYAIRDRSGTLTTIENTGFISAVGSSTDVVYAIDLSSATSDVSITQYMNEDDIATREEVEEDLDEGETDTTVYTSISGAIATGSGNDTLSAEAGTITGNIYFNDGNDQLLLSGDVVYSGKTYFGAGDAVAELSDEASFTGEIDFGGTAGSLSIADEANFYGTLANAESASVVVSGGNFGINGVKTVTVGSLHVGSSGTITAYIDGETGTSSHIIADTATFDSGATVSATINSLEGAEGSYVILSAANIDGNPVFDDNTTVLPYIFTGSVAVSDTELTLSIRRKTASEVGLTNAGASGYDAILTAAMTDDTISQSFLEIMDRDALQTQVSQMLPDHSGGLFDAVTRGTRLISQHVMDRDSMFAVTTTGEMGVWVEPVYWRSNRHEVGTNSYKSSGFGLSGGVEWITDFGYIGGSYAWLHGNINNNGGTGKVGTSLHNIGASWRTGKEGPFYAYARLGAAYASFSSTRTISITAEDTDYTYSSTGKWKGWLFSGMGGVTYDLKPTDHFTIRPKLGLEWFRLSEKGYSESGGGDAVDLTVGKRNSNSLSAATTVALSYVFGPPRSDYHPLTLEIEGGRRTVLAGKLGVTQAYFTDGDTFSIDADPIDDSWLGEVRLLAGGWDYTWKIAAGADKTRNSDLNYSARVSLSIAIY